MCYVLQMRDSFPPFAFVLVACVVTAYLCWPGAHSPLVLDDISNLKPITNNSIDAYLSFVFGNESGPTGRPVSMLSFASNHALNGDYVVPNLKATNLFIHVVCGILVFLVARKLFEHAGASQNKNLLASLVACMWIINPLNTHLCFYVIQRMTQLSCLFVLLGVLAFFKARTAGLSHEKRIAWLIAVFVCWFLAVFSKENALLFPLYILVIETYFISAGADSFRLRRITGLVILLGALSAIIALTLNVFDYSSRPFSAAERIYTQPVVLIEYVRELLIPTRADVGVFQDDYNIQESFLNFSTPVSFAVILGAILFSLFGPISTKLQPVFGGILLFFAGHAIESTVIPLELYFQHRNYFPSIGIFIALVAAANYAIQSQRMRPVIVLCAIAHAGLSLYFTSRTAEAWESYPQLVVNAYENHPTSVRASASMVDLLTRAGQIDNALLVNASAINNNPGSALIITAQRFYVHCVAQRKPLDADYEYLNAEIKPLNFIELSTALNNLYTRAETEPCQLIDFNRVTEKIAHRHDEAIRKGTLMPNQSWSINYYLIDYYRRTDQHELMRARLRDALALGVTEAQFYRDEFRIEI